MNLDDLTDKILDLPADGNGGTIRGRLGTVAASFVRLQIRRALSDAAGLGHDTIADASGRPNFAAFAQALRDEARWQAELHTGQHGQPRADGDVAALRSLAERVERVGDHLGYIAKPPAVRAMVEAAGKLTPEDGARIGRELGIEVRADPTMPADRVRLVSGASVVETNLTTGEMTRHNTITGEVERLKNAAGPSSGPTVEVGRACPLCGMALCPHLRHIGLAHCPECQPK